ncbi:unnamed protein product [Gordionus sp. m RMFG-2023]
MYTEGSLSFWTLGQIKLKHHCLAKIIGVIMIGFYSLPWILFNLRNVKESVFIRTSLIQRSLTILAIGHVFSITYTSHLAKTKTNSNLDKNIGLEHEIYALEVVIAAINIIIIANACYTNHFHTLNCWRKKIGFI